MDFMIPNYCHVFVMLAGILVTLYFVWKFDCISYIIYFVFTIMYVQLRNSEHNKVRAFMEKLSREAMLSLCKILNYMYIIKRKITCMVCDAGGFFIV